VAREQIHFPVGEQLPGTKYRVVRKLGQGGMGVVLEVVKDPNIRGVVKIIHPALAAEPEFRRRFFDEVRLLAELEHPNIVRVTDYDELADGTPYFAMELLSGSTVKQAIRNVGNVQPLLLHQIMLGLLEGLEYVHSHHPLIVHRDIKSENVFIHVPAYGDPCVKLIDFGVAGGDGIVERRGYFVGTPRYAAPEQLRGERATAQVDLYAAALVLYEGLAGRGPFDDVELVPEDRGDRQKAFVRAHLSIEAPSICTFAPWVPPVIEELLCAALSKDPGKRPESASAFASRLYALQFLGEAPLNVNTTAQTLVTMVTATSSDEGDAPAGSLRAERRDALNDTSVDAIAPAPLAKARPEDARRATPTVRERAVLVDEGQPAPVEPARATPPFVAEEASERGQERREPVDQEGLPPAFRQPRISSDAGTSRSVRSKGPTAERAWLAIVVGITLVAGLAIAVTRLRSDPAPDGRLGVVRPATSAPGLAPLPPEEPAKAVGSAASAAAGAVPAVVPPPPSAPTTAVSPRRLVPPGPAAPTSPPKAAPARPRGDIDRGPPFDEPVRRRVPQDEPERTLQ
jgi:serine/threonine protein kinase